MVYFYSGQVVEFYSGVDTKLCEDRRPPEGPNDVWAMDFLSDQLFDGRKIRVLTIVDALSKVSPAIDVHPQYTGADVVATLERVTAEYGLPDLHPLTGLPLG